MSRAYFNDQIFFVGCSPWPSMTIIVNVERTLSILLTCQVIVSLSLSIESELILAIMSLTPYTPDTSTVSGIFFISRIISSSEPKSQLIRTYAVGMYVFDWLYY